MEGSLPGAVSVWRQREDGVELTRQPPVAPERGEVLVQVEGAVLRSPHATVGGVVGIVVAAGLEAAGWISRRVLVPELLSCGACAVCQRGRAPACMSAVRLPAEPASHVLLPARGLVAVEGPLAAAAESAPWRLAALAGPGARIYHAFARAGLGPGELAILVGETPEARLGERLAAIKAAQSIVVGVDAGAEEVRRRAGEPTPRVWRVFETTSTSAGVRCALGLGAASRTGTISLLVVGQTGASTLEIDLPAVAEVPLLVTGPPHPELVPELLALCARGDLPLDTLTSRLTERDLTHVAATSNENSIVILTPSATP